MGAIKSYLNASSSLWYAYLACLPLFVLYELLMWIGRLNAPETADIRLTAELWVQQLLFCIHHNTLLLSLLVILLLGGIIWYLEGGRRPMLRLRWFLMMILEAAFWAGVLAVLVTGLLGFLWYAGAQIIPGMAALAAAEGVSSIYELSFIQRMALSLGAGLYEELVFRVLLVFGLFYGLNYFMKEHRAQISAILIAAFLFSLVHYIGPFGDAFTLYSFLFRMIFGLALNALLLIRGFGITAWTHALYDIFVLAF